MFNTTNSTDIANPLGWFQYANEVSEGWFGALVLLSIFIIIVLVSVRHDTVGGGFAIGGVVCIILSIIFFATGLIASNVLAYFIVLGAASVILMYFKG